jgi:hypothetical protein
MVPARRNVHAYLEHQGGGLQLVHAIITSAIAVASLAYQPIAMVIKWRAQCNEGASIGRWC